MTSRRNHFTCLLIASLVSIFLATIYPFDFSSTRQLSYREIVNSFISTTTINDYVRNILLFTPLGIALSGTIAVRRFSRWQMIIFSFLFSALLSGSIELIQILLPSRTSSLSDLVCNSLGGVWGASLYCWRRDFGTLINEIINSNYKQVNLKFLAMLTVIYCVAVSIAIALLISNINFSNWEEDYYLSIGSEVTGDASWNGYITSLHICDRALDDSEISTALTHTHSFFSKLPSLVASLIFTSDRQFYSDYSQQLPNFIWQSDIIPSCRDNHNRLKPACYNRWLKSNFTLTNVDWQKNTKASNLDYQIHHHKTVLFESGRNLISLFPVTQVNRRIKKTQEFSLSLILATKKYKQPGPSRIVSLANNIYTRNLMLAQSDTNLVFRLRTPTTSTIATQPYFVIPDFFDDLNLHQILITFARRKLTFYVDRQSDKYTFEFQPSTHLKMYSPFKIKLWRINLKNHSLLKSQIAFYSLILLPLAVSVVMIILGFNKQFLIK